MRVFLGFEPVVAGRRRNHGTMAAAQVLCLKFTFQRFEFQIIEDHFVA